jgi:hypothetical protein
VAVAGLGRESAAQAPKFQKPAPYQLTDQERREVEDAIKAIERILGNNTMPHDARAEVEVYHKAGVWTLREGYTKRLRIPSDYAFIPPLKGVGFRLFLR